MKQSHRRLNKNYIEVVFPVTSAVETPELQYESYAITDNPHRTLSEELQDGSYT